MTPHQRIVHYRCWGPSASRTLPCTFSSRLSACGWQPGGSPRLHLAHLNRHPDDEVDVPNFIVFVRQVAGRPLAAPAFRDFCRQLQNGVAGGRRCIVAKPEIITLSRHSGRGDFPITPGKCGSEEYRR